MTNEAFKVAAAGVLIAAVASCQAAYQYGTRDDVSFTVTDKERVVSGGEEPSSKYIVFTEDKNGEVEVFENTDAWLSGKFAASNVQAELQEGQHCDATVYGWGFPVFSTYRNILEVDCNPREASQEVSYGGHLNAPALKAA